MSFPPQFLDEVRARTSLSGLIGQSLTLTKAGREFKACCPFHNEKTASFTVNDEKGFYHCFSCSAHGDVIRWMIDSQGLLFVDAVKELAAAAGLEVPARSPAAAAQAARVAGIRPVLEAAQVFYARELEVSGAVMEYLAQRGIGADLIAAFGLGFAPDRRGYFKEIGSRGDAEARSVSGSSTPPDQETLVAAGLMMRGEDGTAYPVFRNRIMIPVHDQRGRIVSFGGRIFGSGEPKYKNGPATELFDKGRMLFNLHRAAPAAHREKRLLIVEGYFDVIALAGAGIHGAVAPMGTALTPAQIALAWRVHQCPTLMFDGDAAGIAAARRAAETALPGVGPGQSITVALCGAGLDPDDLVRAGGADAIEAVCARAQGLTDYIFEQEAAA